MSVPDRLYGLPDAEYLHGDIGDVIDEIDQIEDPADGPWTITGWTVRSPIDGVPSAEWIVDLVAEHTAENGDFIEDPFNGAEMHKDAEVLEAAQRLREVIASKIAWHMVDKLVETWTYDGGDNVSLVKLEAIVIGRGPNPHLPDDVFPDGTQGRL